MTTSAHRPMAAARERRWKVVRMSGPTSVRVGRCPSGGDHTPAAVDLAVDHQEVAGRLVEDVRPVGGADHDVLDPDTEPAGQVDARLDAESNPSAQLLLVSRN